MTCYHLSTVVKCIYLCHLFIFSELLVNPKRSSHREVTSHRWTKGNTLSFEFSSNSGHPKTLSLTLSAVSRDMDARDDTYNVGEDDMGCAFFDLTPVWNQIHKTSNQTSITSNAQVFLFEDQNELFDQHGVAESRSNDKEVRVSLCTVLNFSISLNAFCPFCLGRLNFK